MTYFKHFRHASLAVALVFSSAVAFAAPATYNVRTGETLDQVIRQTMGSSPLRIELLRQAFMDQNPKAFTKTTPRYLMAGSVLTVPNHDELLRQHLSVAKPATGVIDERKFWVRYP